MINGDGTREGVSEVASFDPLDSSASLRALKIDGGSAASSTSSRYSSCGESEFERYCSANSAMGTPSMCSTITVFNDFPESESGYAKNFGFSDDSGLENFSLGGSERYQPDNIIRCRKMELSEKVIDGESSMNYGSSGLNLYESGELIGLQEAAGDILCWKVGSSTDVFRGVEMNNGSDNGVSSEDEREATMVGKETSESRTVEDSVLGDATNKEVLVEYLEGAAVANDTEFAPWFEESLPYMVDKESDGEVGHMEDDASGNEHSESEDSLYNFLSDNNHKDGTCLPNNAHSLQETNMVKENPLLINSSVAFGSDDWNDFECETQGCSLNSLTMDVFQGSKPQNLNSSSLTLTGSPIDSVLDRGEDVMLMPVACAEDQPTTNFLEKDNSTHGARINVEPVGKSKDMIQVKDIPVAVCQVQASADFNRSTNRSYLTEANPLYDVESEQDAKDIFVINNQAEGEAYKTLYNSKCSDGDDTGMGTVAEISPTKPGMCIVDGTSAEQPYMPETEENIGIDCQVLESRRLGNLKANIYHLGDTLINKLSSRANESCENMENSTAVPESEAPQPTFGSRLLNISSISTDLPKDHLPPIELGKLDLNDFHDEVVHEMEEILLDSGDSPGARFTFTGGYKMSQSLLSLPLRDGGSTASTSDTGDFEQFNQQASRIDGVEVIGARQKRGNVSFSERLVGVKEYTVYKIRVWSGREQWEVERRYRDFYSLYCQLKSFFADHGWSLPSPWLSIENKTRKIFGSASPDIIAERSVVIQECLCSILHSRFLSTIPSPLIWFLSPQESAPGSLASDSPGAQSSAFARVTNAQKFSSLGKTISLVVEIQPHKSTKQILEQQHYTCAGCHRHFDDQKTLMKGFVQTFGWGKPRLCEYTCQLFCSLCHTNEMAVIPARVLHHWDFARYPVSQLAKSYLDSIHDQPMLCVSAVNPFLFSKVPALLHVMSVRKKIGNMFSYVRCPFRKSINRGLGFRRYLVESNDFFALRDLIDLSKGAFAALPMMLEIVERKILEHIVEKCLVCCDVGVPCGARQLCGDPLSLIFPFLELEVERCKSCKSGFHKPCFGKLTHCPCGSCLDETNILLTNVERGLRIDAEGGGAVNSLLRKSTSILSLGSFSGLFGKSNQTKEDKGRENVILMGSLPSTSLS